MIHNADSPPVLGNRVIEDGLAKMTPRFKCVSPLSTERADTRARAERDRVRCVINMGDRVEGPGLIFYRERIDMGGVCESGGWRWKGKVQSVCGKTFSWGFECYCRCAECSTEQAGDTASQRVPCEPDLRVGVEVRQVVV